MTDRTFCTYIYTDPKTNMHRYIGKGLLSRPTAHLRESHNIQLDRLLKKRYSDGYAIAPKILIAQSEEDAIEMEILLIALIGREDLNQGTLFNKTDGGDGATRIVGQAAKKRLSEANRKRYENPEARRITSEASKKAYSSLELRQRCAELQRQRWTNPTVRQRAAEALRARYADGRQTNRDGIKAYWLSEVGIARRLVMQTDLSLKNTKTKSKSCTVDGGTTVWQSKKMLIAALGWGKSGWKSPDFMWVVNGEFVRRTQ